MIQIAPLPALFRPGTSHVYPPFKNGRYMEEYVYEWMRLQAQASEASREASGKADNAVWVYLPVFWTNLQNHPGFAVNRPKYQHLLNQCVRGYPAGVRFFTCVQHDDGCGMVLPAGTRVYGACTGDIPLPLVYEDTTERLVKYPRRAYRDKDVIASFVGTLGTHPVREALRHALEGRAGMVFSSRGAWSASVGASDAERFLEVTSRSRFCLAPRGYGRSSFRFFEAMWLDVLPVYVWDDVEWLPYQGEVPYHTFCVSVHLSELSGLYERLTSIGEAEYEERLEAMRRWRSWFGLEGMCRWVEASVAGACAGARGL